MKDLFQKITSIFMAFVVLFSTMSFAVAIHYCGNTIVDTSFFGKAESCGMETQKVTDFDGCSLEKDTCCSDEVITINGQDELSVSSFDYSFSQLVFIQAFIVSYVSVFKSLDKKTSILVEYPPPLIVQDIQLLDAVFLI